LRVQRRPHRSLLPLACRPVRGQKLDQFSDIRKILSYDSIKHVFSIDQVVEVEVDGVKQRSGVLIKKCRYD
jgi:hypothetical protein